MHGEISTVNGEHFLADIMVMSSTRKFARGDKKNYAFFITFSLKFWKIPPPPTPSYAINIWKIVQPPTISAPPLPTINIWKIFQSPTISTPRLLATKEYAETCKGICG